ncbi:MAG: hypothetical protein ACR2OO_09370 [Thermomicrobiales bacterium]
MTTNTITLQDDLAEMLEKVGERHDPPIAPDELAQIAIREYLEQRTLRRPRGPLPITPAVNGDRGGETLERLLVDRGYASPRGPLRITPADTDSGVNDLSVNHDRYFAE